MKVGTVAAAAAAAVLLLAGGAPGGARAAWEDEAPALRDALAGVDSIIASGAKEAEQLETLPLFARDDEGAKLVALEVGERVAASSARREDPQPAAGAQQQPALVSGSGKPMRPATVVGAPSSRASVVSDASAVFVSDAESSAESAAPRMVVARVARALPIDPHASRLVDPLPLVPAAVGDPRAPQPLRAGLARAERELPTLASNAVPPEALRPTDHLLQDTLSGIKNVEALDVGATRGTAERERLAKLTALARALPGPAPIGESKTAADALRQVGEVAEKLAHRVSALDAQSKGLMETLYGTSSSRRDEESQEIVRVAQEARARRETEVAQLVRDEVRVLTDKVNMELRGLRGQFLAELRDTLTTLRSSLQKELVRAQEERSRLTAMAAGNLPAGSVDVRDEIALEPQRAMANLDSAIAHQVNSAFNKAQAIAQTVMADRRSAAGAAAAASAAAAAAAPYEPSAKQLSGSIRAQADAARAYDNLVAQAKAANKAAAAAADTISPSAATQAAVAQAAERAMEASESGSPRLFML